MLLLHTEYHMYSPPCILRLSIEKCGLKLKVVLNGGLFVANIRIVLLMST